MMLTAAQSPLKSVLAAYCQLCVTAECHTVTAGPARTKTGP